MQISVPCRGRTRRKLGACAMTTKFLDNKIFTFKFYCHDVSHEKQRFGQFSSLPPCPPPPERRKFYFYCRLAFSEKLNSKLERNLCRTTPRGLFCRTGFCRLCFMTVWDEQARTRQGQGQRAAFPKTPRDALMSRGKKN